MTEPAMEVFACLCLTRNRLIVCGIVRKWWDGKVCACVWWLYRYIYFANPTQWVFIPFCVPWRTTCPKLLCYTWTLLESICFSWNNCWHLHTRTAWLLFSINLGRLRSGLSVSLFFSPPLSLSHSLLSPSLTLSLQSPRAAHNSTWSRAQREKQEGKDI